MLTQQEVHRAEKRDGIEHPVITLLEQYTPELVRLNVEYCEINDPNQRQVYTSQNFGFLADAIEVAGSFTLSPLELIAIWSKAREVISAYPRYSLAGMLYCAYGIQGIQNTEWRGFTRNMLEDPNQLPQRVVGDRGGLLYVKNRSEKVYSGVKEIDVYVFGIENPMQRIVQLTLKINQGNQQAQRQLDKIQLHEKQYDTPLLKDVRESFFTNGRAILANTIYQALKQLTSAPSQSPYTTDNSA